jgi:hypothetical protein
MLAQLVNLGTAQIDWGWRLSVALAGGGRQRVLPAR